VKPGTRCECWTEGGHRHLNAMGQCFAGATRLVTVTERVVPIFRPGTPDGRIERHREVPMCAACAEYHENK
jgi:hypothetical protein